MLPRAGTGVVLLTVIFVRCNELSTTFSEGLRAAGPLIVANRSLISDVVANGSFLDIALIVLSSTESKILFDTPCFAVAVPRHRQRGQ